YGSRQTLFNLTSLEVVADLLNVEYYFDGGYLLLSSNNKLPFSVSENTIQTNGLYACVINVQNGSIVYKADDNSNLINVTISNGLLITVCADATSVYKLGNTLSLKKHYENEYDLTASFSNVNSLYTSSNYYLTNYHRVFSLNERVLLVENSKVVTGTSFDITGGLSNGQHRNYKNDYFIVDLENNVQFEIDNDGSILEFESVDLQDNYFALIEIPVENKQTMLVDEKLISYYQIAKADGEYKLIKLVEYDFSNYGKVVGYNGKGLFTSGGAKSKYIDFSGNVKDFEALEEENSKITQSTYNDVVVVSSVQGEKRIYDNKSNLLVGKVFTQVSPFVEGSAVALFGDQYYLVSNSGLVRSINGFADEFSKYVFMGIGYFFVGEQGDYKVYDNTAELLYSGVDVKLDYNALTHKVTMSIQGDDISKVIVINPVEDIFTSENLINYFEILEQKSFAPVQKATVDEDIYIDRKVDYASSTENHTVGGVAQKLYNISFSNLNALAYRSYSSLNTKEASMIPKFDQGATGQQIYKVAAENTYDNKERMYTFEGVYFVGDNEYYTLALIRLQENADYYYMVTLAVKDAYLSRVDSKSRLVEGEAYAFGSFYDYRIDAMNYTFALDGTDSLALSYSDLKTKLVGVMWSEKGKPDQTPYSPSGQDIEITPRQVDLETAGFDGGIIFTTAIANSLNISFTIRNTFEATSQKSLVVANGETKDCGRYTLSYSGSNLRVNAKPGYFLTYFDIYTGSSTDASYTNISSGSLIGGSAVVIASADFTVPSASYIQLKNVSIVESYSYLNLIRYNKTIQQKLDESGNVVLDEDEEPVLEVVELEEFEVLDVLYYYYGYGSDVRTERNPARIGFSEFKRRTSVEIPEKDGYTFLSYTLVDIEEKNIR
ncbi:MAG: hypothetical protein IJB98_02505, partial [Clostridia bacterium]|nr:hypothetical protein [Clostridia bacterium]